LIFADPPYNFDTETYKKIIALAQKKISPQGQIIIEHFNKVDLTGLEGYDSSRNYGSATFSFFNS